MVRKRKAKTREPKTHEPKTHKPSEAHPGVCPMRGTTEEVHRGLCRKCRRRIMGKGTLVAADDKKPPRDPELEPPHSRPWVERRGG